MNEVRNIVLLGSRNAGKSTLANMIAGQEVAIVSPVAGTTTDPVRKRMEIKGVGPCNLIDTAGIDDEGEVGSMRSERSFREADGADLALVLFTGNRFGDYERAVANYLKTKSVPFILVHSKEDVCSLDESLRMTLSDEFGCPIMNVSCNRASDRDLMLSAIARMLNDDGEARVLVPKSLAGEGDRVILVCPIDKGAPEGRLILPQVKTLRALLDNKAVVTVVQPSELEKVFESDRNYKVVITDSQAFSEVSAIVPEGIPVGSFSILMARLKGPFGLFLESVKKIDSLNAGDRVLILESCTHRSSCDDIGRVKIPAMLKKYTGKQLLFDFVSGLDDIPYYSDAASGYALAIQCGGCMATARQITSRVCSIAEKGIPVTNYGLAIAYVKGLFNNANFKAFLNLIAEE